MTAEELLATLHDRRVRLHAVDGRLLYAAPDGALTPDLVDLLRTHKTEVVRLLAGSPACATCGTRGQCQRRLSGPEGGWSCAAAVDAGLVEEPVEQDADDQLRWHERH